ncbi:MAG: calcium-binding protein [Thermodesulfovibrionales bacterium]
MAHIKEDKEREERIVMEAVVDAYNETERAMGWYYYLEGKLRVPFQARCKAKRAISPLKVEEEVQVLSMAPEEECESEIFVLVSLSGDEFAVPLSQLEGLSKDPETQEAVGDWHYWVGRGYEF